MNEVLIPLPPAYNLDEGTLFLDTNVIMNYLAADPTGATLNYLLNSSVEKIVVTATVEAELRANVTGEKFAVFNFWMYNNFGRVVPYGSNLLGTGRNGEQSIVDAILSGNVGGAYIVASGDSGDDWLSQLPNDVPVLSSVGYANALLISGDITYGRYLILLGQLAVVAPHEFISGDNPLVYVPGMKIAINGVLVEFRANGLTVDGQSLGLGGRFSIHPERGLEVIENIDCFLSGTPILLSDDVTKPIEDVVVGDIVQSYTSSGTLAPGRVTRTFRNEVLHLLDVHGLKVTPGHATLCGEGMFKGRHVPIIDILLSDGALVRADGTLIRMAINASVGSVADAFVKVAVALTPEDMRSDTLTEAEMRVGTLLFDWEGLPVSVLDCLTAEGYAFDPETGLVAKPGETPHPLFWFGRLPRPEDYILTRSRETLEGILTDGEWEGSRSQLIEGRLRQTKMMRVN